MRLFIDIDKTIATDPEGRNTARYLSRQLGITAEPSETLTAYMSRAEVKAWAANNPEHFKKIWTERQDDADIHWQASPAPGSRWLLLLLSLVSDLSYFTCRLPEAREVTQTWLEKFQFPSPSRVSYCEHALHKVKVALKSTAGSTHPIILIDDHAPDLLQAVRHLAREGGSVASRIRDHFLLVQFGGSDILEHPQGFVRVATLPHWGLVPFVRALWRLRTDVVDVEKLLGSACRKEEILPPRMVALQERIAAAQRVQPSIHDVVKRMTQQGGSHASLPHSTDTDNEPL